MTAFNAKTVSLSGLNLIEASAGTGKTYTLAELYLRLILEHGLKVSEILVVTYTRAATEELRDRLRQKLVDARDDLLKAPDDRDIVTAYIEAEEVRNASYKLSAAIQSFDEAAIFTIHGFCQRVLTDFAFESGLRFELELVGDDLALLQSATDDFWRREISMADKDFVTYLLAKHETPETLLRSVRSLVGKPYVQILPVPEMNLERCVQQAQKHFDELKKVWQEENEQVIATFNNKALLNGNKYRSASVKKWLALLTNMLAQETMPVSVFEGFEKFTQGKMEEGLKKGQDLPELYFWRVCENVFEHFQQLQHARELQHQQLRVTLLGYLRESLPEQKLKQQVQSYDDLLINLEQALNGQRGDWLVEQLRQQYRAALIDEFQDTDPVQYASFSRIYADSGLPTFLVGDPKQAIYSFRGADIFTYLKAKSRAEHEHTLTTNWRSHPTLVTAVNSLFERHSEAFIYQDIPFNAVGYARDEAAALVVDDSDTSALQILWSGSEKPMAKRELTVIAATTTADEIATLLNKSYDGQASLVDEKTGITRDLTGGDIAVLVRNHRQANVIQQCLQQRGINSVQQGRDNVFTSSEALLLERVLLAIAEPNNEQRVTAALASTLWDFNASELYELKQDETQWHAQLDFFYELHQLWLKHGFMRVFRQCLVSISAEQRLLSLPDGERQLTNLNHIAELIQSQFRHQNDSMEAVLYWLETHIQSAEANDEAAQLRLESDEQLVKIITIHKSKGLEYPIVFCPFLWDANLRSANDTVISFHQDDDSKQACAAFSEPALSQAAKGVTIEEQAEDSRLLYVALTRARERCIIIWGNVSGRGDGTHVSDSALFSLLHPTLDEQDGELMYSDLQELAQKSGGTISIDRITEQETVMYDATSEQAQSLSARPFKGSIDQHPWNIGSFSALTKGHDAELPDYDAQTSVELVTVPVVERSILDRFSFPRGAQAGTCLHALFEYWDFTSQDDDAMTALVSRTLLQYGFEDKWTVVVCQWLKEVLATPLNKESLSLGQISQAKRLDELAFYFPVVELTVNSIQQALLPLFPEPSPLRTVIKRLGFYKLTGFMKGFIDLVFEHEGRFYIVDYKSNHLGNNQADYQSEQLDNAMISHDYPLQYLIYTLALHRYLKLRLPHYDPEQHLGGAYYLFIRGMNSEWERAGIFYDKPDLDVLNAFDRCIQGAGNE